jgi:phage tail-like protein
MSYYPPPAFHFEVRVPSLPPAELAGEEVPEGGENRFVQKYPVRAKYPELVLKRGLLVRSDFFDWIRECIQDLKITLRDVDVVLLNPEHQPLFTWHLVNAYATKWTLADLNASANSVSVETLQLFYQYFTVDRSAVVAARP